MGNLFVMPHSISAILTFTVSLRDGDSNFEGCFE